MASLISRTLQGSLHCLLDWKYSWSDSLVPSWLCEKNLLRIPISFLLSLWE